MEHDLWRFEQAVVVAMRWSAPLQRSLGDEGFVVRVQKPWCRTRNLIDPPSYGGEGRGSVQVGGVVRCGGAVWDRRRLAGVEVAPRVLALGLLRGGQRRADRLRDSPDAAIAIFRTRLCRVWRFLHPAVLLVGVGIRPPAARSLGPHRVCNRPRWSLRRHVHAADNSRRSFSRSFYPSLSRLIASSAFVKPRILPPAPESVEVPYWCLHSSVFF